MFNQSNVVRLRLRNKYFILNFSFEIVNEEFENDKIFEKSFLYLTKFTTCVFDSNLKLSFFLIYQILNLSLIYALKWNHNSQT